MRRLLLGLALAASTYSASAQAHKIQAPDGMIVDYSDLELELGDGKTVDCCADQHCRPVESRWNPEFLEMEILLPSGWTSVDRTRVLDSPSPDGEYHACVVEGETVPRCIWEPSRGS